LSYLGQADGTAEYDAGLLLVADLMKGRKRRITLGADKVYDTQDFVATVRELGATPHVPDWRRRTWLPRPTKCRRIHD